MICFRVEFYLLAVILKLCFIMQKMQELNVVERLKAPTPRFFRVVRTVGLLLGTIGGTLLAAPVAIPATLTTIAGYLVTAGAVTAAVSQSTVDWKAYEQQKFVGI